MLSETGTFVAAAVAAVRHGDLELHHVARVGDLVGPKAPLPVATSLIASRFGVVTTTFSFASLQVPATTALFASPL